MKHHRMVYKKVEQRWNRTNPHVLYLHQELLTRLNPLIKHVRVSCSSQPINQFLNPTPSELDSCRFWLKPSHLPASIIWIHPSVHERSSEHHVSHVSFFCPCWNDNNNLLTVINHSLSSGSVLCFKTASVSDPLKALPRYNRATSKLPFISKTLEKAVDHQLLKLLIIFPGGSPHSLNNHRESVYNDITLIKKQRIIFVKL